MLFKLVKILFLILNIAYSINCDAGAMATLIAGSVTAGSSLLTSFVADNSFSVRAEIQIENWTKWPLKHIITHIHGGVLSNPLIDILPLKKEKMVYFFILQKT